MVQRLGNYDGMSKNDWKHLRWGMEKDGACKMDRQNKRCSYARKSGRRKNNAGSNKEEENKLAGSLAEKELPAEGCSRTAMTKVVSLETMTLSVYFPLPPTSRPQRSAVAVTRRIKTK